MFGESESPVAYGETGVPSLDNASGAGMPEYMGMGSPGFTDQGHAMQPPFQSQPIHQFPTYAAPGMTDSGHAMKPPFQTQPIHQFQPEYAAPGFTDQGHAMKPPFQSQPIHQFQPQYAAPGMTDQGHALKPPFQTQPIHQFPTYGAASGAMPANVRLSAGDGEIYTLRADQSYVLENARNGTQSLVERKDIDWDPTHEYVQSLWAAGKLKPVGGASAAKGKGQGAADFLSAFTETLGLSPKKFEPSGQAASIAPPEPFWTPTKIALAVGGVVGVGALIYFATRDSK